MTTTVALANSVYREYCNTVTQSSSGSQNVSDQSEYFKKQWVRTPNYRQLVRSKSRLPDNNFDLETWKKSTGLVSYRQVQTNPCGGDWTERLVITNYQKAPFTYVGGLVGVKRLTQNSCVSQLLSRARGAEFSVPIFVGEGRETVNLVLGTAQRLARSYRSLRSGNLPRALDALGLPAPSRRAQTRYNRQFGRDPSVAASNFWLESQYGWIPLLNDAKNAAETLAETLTQSSSTEGRVTARSSLNSVSSGTTQIEVSPSGFAHRVASQQESYKAVWRFEPTVLSVPASLGLLNPLSVAWELVPLSFVVDWFLPIGRYLEQLDSPFRFKHLGGTLGYKRTVVQYFDQFVRDGAIGSGNFNTSYLYVERKRFTEVPSLGLESIWFDPNLGVRRLFSGLALARQAFR